MKPVEHVLTRRMKIGLKIADGIAAIRKKQDRLIFLHALRFHQLPQPSPRFLVIGLDKTEAFGRRPIVRLIALEGDDALAGDDFEKAVLVPGAGHAAVDAHGHGPIR